MKQLFKLLRQINHIDSANDYFRVFTPSTETSNRPRMSQQVWDIGHGNHQENRFGQRTVPSDRAASAEIVMNSSPRLTPPPATSLITAANPAR